MIELSQTAFVLHSRPYRENQLLLELLTERDGKVPAITYTGNSPKSNKRALLQPFTLLNVELRGKSSLRSLRKVEALQKTLPLSGNHLYSGFYVNELLVRLLGEHIACSDLFFQYHKSIQALAQHKTLEPILRSFEMTLLEELGMTLDFTAVFVTDVASFYYLPEQGFVAAYSKMSQPCYDKKHLIAIAENNLDSLAVLQSYKVLMRQVITHLLDGKPLNSRKLFKP